MDSLVHPLPEDHLFQTHRCSYRWPGIDPASEKERRRYKTIKSGALSADRAQVLTEEWLEEGFLCSQVRPNVQEPVAIMK